MSARVEPLSIWRVTRTSAPPDPAQVTQRAAAWARQVREVPYVLLLTLMQDDGQVATFVASAASNASARVAGNFETAVAGRIERVEAPLDLDMSAPVRAVTRVADGVTTRATQAGSDPSETARVIASSLGPGSWVGVTLRAPSKVENRRARLWHRHRLADAVTHYSSSTDALVASFWAGGPHAADSAAVLASAIAATPGFDLDVSVRPVPVPRAGAVAFAVLGMLAAAWAWFVAHRPWLAVALGVLGVLVGVGLGRRGARRAGKVQQEMAWLGPPAAPHRRVPPARPRAQAVDRVSGRVRGARSGGYPLASTGFLVGPAMVTGWASPHGGTTSSAASARRDVPASLRERVGPLIGASGPQEVPVYVSARDAHRGLVAFGEPNSGKSVLLTNLFRWSMFDRACRSGLPGTTGGRHAVVVFESKEASAVEAYRRAAQATGEEVIVVDVADASTPAVDLFDAPGSVSAKADFFAAMMQYAFKDGSIQYQSLATLAAVFTLAQLVTPDDVEAAGLRRGSSVMDVAYVLLGGFGDEAGVRLAAAVASRYSVMSPDDRSRDDLAEALDAVSSLYGQGVSASRRATLQSAPVSKVKALRQCAPWWDPGRVRMSFAAALRTHSVVVINTSTSVGGAAVSSVFTELISAMLLFALKAAIERECRGWFHAGRAVSIFSDELSLLASDADDTFGWLRDQGRAFGVRMYLATQRPAQLPPRVKEVVLTLGTKLWLAQSDPATLKLASEDLSTLGVEVPAAEIAQLPPYVAFVRTKIDGVLQPIVLVALASWLGREERFAADQGFAAGAVATAAPVAGPLARLGTAAGPVSVFDDDGGDHSHWFVDPDAAPSGRSGAVEVDW